MNLLRGLRAQILIWTILPLILTLVAVSFGSIALHQSNMRTMVAERNTRLANVAASQLSDNLDHHVLAMQAIASQAASSPVPTLPPSSQSLISGFDHGLGLFDAQGNLLAQTSAPSLDGQTLAWATQAAAVALSQPGRPVFVAIPGAGERRLVMALADPTGKLATAGATSADSLHIPALLGQLQTGRRVATYVLDAEGTVIFGPDQSPTGQGAHVQIDPAQVQRVKRDAAFLRPAGGGDEHVIATALVTSSDWRLVIDEPWADVIVPVLQYTLLAPLIVLVAAVGSLAAVGFGLRRVIRPLQVLGYRSSRVAWGDYDAIRQPVGGIGEIGDLQRTLQQMAEQIQHYQAGMQDYIAALTQGQEEERRRLARDLHDDTVQTLVALSQRVKMVELDLAEAGAQADLGKLQQAQERARELSLMVNQTLHSVRQTIRGLRPVFLEELGLTPGLEALVKGAQRENLVVALEVTGDERRLAANKELAVFRLAQEALSNVQRHAAASEVSVQLDFSDEGVTLTVNDNGKGFIPPDVPADLALKGHFGLMGMYERTSLLGGHLSIRSSPNQGTKVVAFVPA